jgi:predicted PurR-regulated permease PerM
MVTDSPEARRAAAGIWSARDTAFARDVVIATLVVIALGALAMLLWRFAEVFLLVFAAVIVAAILHAIADPLVRRARVSRTAGLWVAILVLVLAIGGTAWLFEAQVGGQVGAALSGAQGGLGALGERFGVPELPGQVSEALQRSLSPGDIMGKVTSIGTAALAAIANLVLVLFGGVYLAMDPRLYRDGIVKLFPAAARGKVAETMDNAGRALKLWLLGQLVSMVLTGLMTWAALALIGLPSAAGLGIIAGVAEFVPLIGPFAGAVPALLVASGLGWTMVLWTAAAFLVVQQIESNLIQPLVTRRAVSVPPALLLFSVVAFGLIFGTLGVLLAVPLTVVVFVAVAKLYVRETLGEPAEVPGEKKPAPAPAA